MSDLIIKPSGTSANFKVQNPSGTDKIVMNSSGTITTATLGSAVDLGLTANHSGVKTALNASGTAPIYACRAWVNFNGTGTIAIRASGNVTDITDNGAGDYTVNFTTAMFDENYSVVGTMDNGGSGTSLSSLEIRYVADFSTSAIRVNSTYVNSSTNRTYVDRDYICLAIFR